MPVHTAGFPRCYKPQVVKAWAHPACRPRLSAPPHAGGIPAALSGAIRGSLSWHEGVLDVGEQVVGVLDAQGDARESVRDVVAPFCTAIH